MNMKNKISNLIGLIALMFLIAANISAQKTVTGVVTDDLGPVVGASVIEVGTQNGVITDIDGKFTLTNVSNSGQIKVSYIGYLPQTFSVANQTTFNVKLIEDSQNLEEIVVIGYGTQRKNDVTGSIASLSSDALKAIPSGNVTQSLQGRVAGVQMEQNSTRPGAGMEIRIRGTRSLTASNDPLIVLDGIPFAGSIGDINPNDINSLDILKDASATAIYGSRGANGVILITTNKGTTIASKPTVTYNGYYGAKTLFSEYPMMDGPEFVAYRAEANKNNNNKYPNGSDEDNSVNTNWQDLVFQTGMATSHDVSVGNATQSGGSYNIGVGYYDETTVLPGQGYTRFSLRSSVDQEITKRIKIGLVTQNSYSITSGESNNPMYSILSMTPIAKPYNDDGSIKKQVQLALDPTYNPLMINDIGDLWEEKTKNMATYNSLYGEVNLCDGLKYRLNLGLNYRQSNYGNYRGAETPYNGSTTSNATVRNELTTNWVVENLLYYDKTFGKHKVGLVGMYSAEQTEYLKSQVNVTDVAANFIQYYNLGLLNDAGTTTINPSNQSHYKRGLLSYMFRANYAYGDKYMATLTFRSDGASVLADGHKWHAYPAFSLGWNMRNEDFLKDVSWLDQLKIRAGYGQTSNQSINPYQTLGTLSNYYYNFGNQLAMGYYISGLPNPDLGWEYSSTYNYGLDFSVADSRIRGTLEYYVQNTEDLLLYQNLPKTGGVSSFMANVGSTRNKGFELTLSGTIIQELNGWTWDAGINLFTNKNEITSLASGQDRDLGNGWFVGESINSIYDFKKIGIWQTGEDYVPYEGTSGETGMIKVEYTGDYDANGNPTRLINDDDKQILGSAEPDFQGGFNTSVSYKDFDLSIVGSYQSGGLLVSAIHSHTGYLNLLSGRRGQISVDYWTESNPTNAYPKAGGTEYTNNPKYGSTLAYFDASYCKINTITLGYNLPKNTLKSLGISRLRAYVTAQNPFVFASPYYSETGLDPQPNSKGDEAQATAENSVVPTRINIVGYNTPSTRTYLVGLNITF